MTTHKTTSLTRVMNVNITTNNTPRCLDQNQTALRPGDCSVEQLELTLNLGILSPAHNLKILQLTLNLGILSGGLRV